MCALGAGVIIRGLDDRTAHTQMVGSRCGEARSLSVRIRALSDIRSKSLTLRLRALDHGSLKDLCDVCVCMCVCVSIHMCVCVHT